MGLVPRKSRGSPDWSPQLCSLAPGPPQMLPSRGVPAPSPCPSPHVSQGRVDVVVGVPVSGDEEGQAAVGRQDVHAAVLVSVPGQQGDAALLHVQRRRDRVQRLQGAAEERGPRQRFLGLVTAPGRKLGQVTNPINRWRYPGPERGGESREPGPRLQATRRRDRALETGICLLATRLSLDKLLYLSASFFLYRKMGY